jgi:hypothetical protein
MSKALDHAPILIPTRTRSAGRPSGACAAPLTMTSQRGLAGAKSASQSGAENPGAPVNASAITSGV